jgi:hypothetical protein
MLVGVTSACAGHAEVTYRGTVVSGERTRHQFASAPAEGSAVEGAIVDLVLVLDGSDCTDSNTREKPSDSATIGADARYKVSVIFGSMLGTPDKVLLVCVRHPDYELAEYRVVFEKTPRSEKDGSKFLNFYLRKQ